jgi:dTMP kinase
VDRLHDLMIATEPDLTILVDIDPALGLSRARARAGTELRFEDMGLQTQIQMRAGFLALAGRHTRFRLIDGARAPDAVAADILRTVLADLG